MKNGTVVPRRQNVRQSGGVALKFKKEEVFQCKGVCHCIENEAKRKAKKKVAARRKKLKLEEEAMRVLLQHSKTKHDKNDW